MSVHCVKIRPGLRSENTQYIVEGMVLLGGTFRSDLMSTKQFLLSKINI
jgi:hypothetical protein